MVGRLHSRWRGLQQFARQPPGVPGNAFTNARAVPRLDVKHYLRSSKSRASHFAIACTGMLNTGTANALRSWLAGIGSAYA